MAVLKAIAAEKAPLTFYLPCRAVSLHSLSIAMEALLIPMMLLASVSQDASSNADVGERVQALASARIIQGEIVLLNKRMFDKKTRDLSVNQPPARSYTIRSQVDEAELRLTEFH